MFPALILLKRALLAFEHSLIDHLRLDPLLIQFLVPLFQLDRRVKVLTLICITLLQTGVTVTQRLLQETILATHCQVVGLA